jgi:hypothetical protein
MSDSNENGAPANPEDGKVRADAPRDTRNATERAFPRARENRGDDPAAGTITSPVAPGEAQAGDWVEQAQNLGGPVDVFPLRGRQRRERPDG